MTRPLKAATSYLSTTRKPLKVVTKYLSSQVVTGPSGLVQWVMQQEVIDLGVTMVGWPPYILQRMSNYKYRICKT